MTRSATRARAVTAALAATAVIVPMGLLSGTAAQAAATRPALTLEVAQRTTTLTRYQEDDGEGGVFSFVDGNLGVYAVAGARAFDVRAERASYSEPVVLTLRQPGADRVLTTAGAFDGLPGFWATTVTDATGRVVTRSTSSFCPNGYEQIRRRPDAPATSPYPQGCSGNPYALGGVYGIQAGYAVPALQDVQAFEALPLGRYTVALSVTERYRRTLGLSRSRAKAAVSVTLVQGSFEEEPHLSTARAAGRAAAGREPSPAAGSAAVEPERSAATSRSTGQVSKPSGPLPDLRSLPAWGIGVEEGRYLTFAATVWNAGPGRLVVDGFRQSDDADLMKAYQYFFSANGQQRGYAPVGTMEWDARDGHDHWHFTDFATYRLLDAKKQLVVRSGKEAFCLANTDAVDYTVRGANWRPSNTDLHSSCGDRQSLGVREVLDAGSGDTYAQYLPGQSFDLRGLKNGTYYIEVRANPDKRLHERRTSNNASYRKVVVGGAAGQRTVRAEKVGIVDESSYDGGEEFSGLR